MAERRQSTSHQRELAMNKKAWKLAFPGLETINDDGGGDDLVSMRVALVPETSRMSRAQMAQPPR